MDGLVLGQLWFHSVQPVGESLESVSKLSREQQRLLQFVLSARENKQSMTRTSWVKAQPDIGLDKWRHSYLSTDFPQTVSHLSLSSLSISSSFWVSSWSDVLSFRARPVRVVVSYTECLLPRAFWNSCIRRTDGLIQSKKIFLILVTVHHHRISLATSPGISFSLTCQIESLHDLHMCVYVMIK